MPIQLASFLVGLILLLLVLCGAVALAFTGAGERVASWWRGLRE